MDRFSLQLLSPDLWKWMLLVIPALCLAFWAYFGLLAPLSRPARTVLWMLRGLAFLVVLFALWQPVATLVLPDSGRPNLAVLLDASGSMALPGSNGHGARGGERDEAYRELQRRLDRFDLRPFGFGEELVRVDADSVGAEGATSLGDALGEILVRSESEPVSGIVVVSDGVNTRGRDPVRIARSSPVPIFTVAVGSDRPLTDLEIRKVRSNARAFAGEPMALDLVLSSSGLDGREARIEIREGDQVRHIETVTLAGKQGVEQEVSIELRPGAPGLALYEIHATVEGDSIPQNDMRQVAVDVLERKTRVLCVADAIDWDFGFLRRTFERDTTLAYSYLVRADEARFRPYGDDRIETLPASERELRDFAAVVLVMSGRERVPESFLEALSGFVRSGGGLFLLGSPGDPAWLEAAPSFASLLPAALERGPRLRAGGLPVEATREGLRHPLTALRENPSQTASLFGALPPLIRPATTLAPRPQAKTLLRYRTDQASLPMLVAGFAERGKVVWAHAHGLWKWRLTASAGEMSYRPYPDLVLGIVRWIAEPAVRDRFHTEPGKRVFQAGETTHFTASLWDAGYEPIPDAGVEVVVRSVDDSTRAPVEITLAPGSEAGEYSAQGPVLQPGRYAFAARAFDPESGRTYHESAGRFWVEPMGPEFARTAIDRESLARIASQSGGVTAELASLGQLADAIPDAVRRMGRIKEIELWNHWFLFAIFVLVLSTEWFLRRRRGLA